MILEAVVLNVIPGREKDFEQAFAEATLIISAMPGFIDMQLGKCLEQESRYLLLVNWRRLEDHTLGFRESKEYQQWRALLHRFYDPFPSVEHYEPLFRCEAGTL